MSDELEFGKTGDTTAQTEPTAVRPAVEHIKKTEAAAEAAESAPAPAPVRVSAHNTAAAAALNAANEEVDIRRKGGEKAQIKIKTTKIA